MEAGGINGCQERHGARRLMARNSMKRLRGEYDLESRGSAFYCTPSAAGANTALPSIYKCGIMLVLKGWCFLHDLLYCCSTVLEHLTFNFASFLANYTFVTRKNREVIDSSCIS